MSTVVKGKAGLTLVRRRNGRTDYVYLGQPAPTDAVEGEIERLVAEGYLHEVEVVDDPELLVATPGPASQADPADPLVGLDLAGLRRYAEDRSIDLGRASTEDGIRTKIRETGTTPVA